ncbi:asparagine synthase (glutamine-hydrolyzing) [Pelagibius sp.]|uniref:asparagine synthase (glutamine-hydrolyzing) n=1 Tax=Pelagibius sp. TaxID=1931238 RepID=UPI0026359414|nr:asparagine synthase (glutamine-hydrolyzing) [Pelagibius sp.]
MCGIFGIVYADGSREPDDARLQRTIALLGHRGPDGRGTYREAGVGLGHTRLSLLDLDERSNQPLWDPEGRYGLVYNGEIYNFKELRQDLEARGLRFRTTSDTEVLLLSLITDGAEATLPRLQGMYAFAFFDRQERSLVLSRDRFGIKPLVLYQDDQQLLFASEVKAFQPWVNLRPNGPYMIRYLMQFGQPVRDKCLFENVTIVPPGALIRIKVGETPRFSNHCDLTEMIDPGKAEELARLSDEQVIDRADELLQSSVEQMLFADTPVGALCSGGVDSSLLMAMAAKRHNNLAIFHANVVGPLSEYDAAAALAKHLKLDLVTVEVHDSDFVDRMAEVLLHYEQPFSYHPHSIPFLLVSKLVQEHRVKAVLTGEGSDECFLGYSRLAQKPFWDFYGRQMDRLAGLVRRVPMIGDQLWPAHDKMHALIGQMLGQFEGPRRQRRVWARYRELTGKEPDRNIQTLEQLGFHLRTLLHRNDTMGMTASIEARFPFLDERLVETAINLPFRHKIRWDSGVWEKEHPFVRDKWILRRVADRYLPKSLSQRKKLGFPVSAYRRMDIACDYFKDALVADWFDLTESDLEFLLGEADQRLKTRLVMLETWGQVFFSGQSLGAISDKLRQHVSFRSVQK